jgi:hypothetical protein
LARKSGGNGASSATEGFASFPSGLALAKMEFAGSGAASGNGSALSLSDSSFVNGLPRKSGGSGASSFLTGGLETVGGEYSDPEDEELKW